jgi:hypothetical protein
MIDGTYVGPKPGQSRLEGVVVGCMAARVSESAYTAGVTLLVDGDAVAVLDEGARLYLDNLVHGLPGLLELGARVAVTGHHDAARAVFIADSLEEIE